MSLSAVTSNCGTGDGGSTAVRSDAAELRRAADATAAADSFHVEITTDGSDLGGMTPPGAVDYEAPDRLHSILRSETGQAEVIAIGSSVYMRHGNSERLFRQSDAPGKGPAQNFLALLRVVSGAKVVNRDGALYRFSGAGPYKSTKALRGDVLLRDGLIARLRYRFDFGGKTFQVTYAFSRYDAAPPVTAPPSDEVVESSSVPYQR